MKQHTDALQTMRLKDLGFPAPKSVSKLSLDWDMDTVPTFNYSIGELIEMLPNEIEKKDTLIEALVLCVNEGGWEVYYTDYIFIGSYHLRGELIDALFDMVITLKGKGII